MMTMMFSPPPDDSTEQSENTDNQGDENEGDEDEGNENQGDDQGDENQGDDQGDDNDGDDQGDENQGDDQGDDNDGDDQGDENQGDDQGDDNDGDDQGDGDDGDDDDDDDDTTTDGVVPSTNVTEWSASVWEELNGTYGTSAVTTDFMYKDGLLYFCNGEGSGFKFDTSNSVYRVQLAGSGNATKCCLQFKVNTTGTLYVDALSSSSGDTRTMNVYANGETIGDGLSIAASGAEHEVKSVEITVSGETTIAVASKSSGINVFTLKWVPTGVTE